MNNTLESFRESNNDILSSLKELADFIENGIDLGVDFDTSILNKISKAVDSLENEKLKIALIGGFSEGKTSIAAAWMEKLDKSSMNINHSESSNEVSIYNVNDDFSIIDTPGLFGFKEQFSEESGRIEKYKEITRKYISEAHIILYVMNSTNPIKSSHKEELNWLLRTLNLLPRTIFVLSRFDEVADVEDINDYEYNFKVKSENIKQRLKNDINLTEKEALDLSIVAVAANPFDMGTEYWVDNIDKFRELSYIYRLQEATAKKIRNIGGQNIVNMARKSVIEDVLHKSLPIAIKRDELIGKEVESLNDVMNGLVKRLRSSEMEIKASKTALRDFLNDFVPDLVLRIRGLSIETFSEFYIKEIGSDGMIISSNLESGIERCIEGINSNLDLAFTGFQADVRHYNNTVSALGKQGVDFIVQSKFISNTTVIAARDGIKGFAATLGTDLGKMLNFKPWGAIKLANKLNTAVAVLGLAFEAYDSYKRMEKENELEEFKVSIIDSLNKQHKSLLDLISSKDFNDQFFPSYCQLIHAKQDVENMLKEQVSKQESFKNWSSKGKVIEGKFRRIE